MLKGTLILAIVSIAGLIVVPFLMLTGFFVEVVEIIVDKLTKRKKDRRLGVQRHPEDRAERRIDEYPSCFT